MDEEDGQNDDAPAVNRRNSGGVPKQERPEEESSWRALRTVGRPKSALRPPSGPPAGGTEDPFGLHESCPPVRALIIGWCTEAGASSSPMAVRGAHWKTGRWPEEIFLAAGISPAAGRLLLCCLQPERSIR